MTSLRKRMDAVMVRELDGELLLLDTVSDRIHQLNPTASFIWRTCDGSTTPEGIAVALAEAFEVEEHIALVDVRKTVDLLVSLNLVIAQE
jgi:hypothetical protein